MKFRVPSAAVAAVVLGAAALVTVDVAKAPTARAVPAETGFAVIANQDAGSSCAVSPTSARDQHVLIAQPMTGALQQDLLKPVTVSGMLNEAKPFDRNNKIVALWGRIDSARKGGVGVYDLKAGAWTNEFSLPDDFGGGDGLAHSVAALPGDAFAVAQTGTIAGAGWGYVVIFDSGGAKRQQVALKGVHGVEWDGARNALFAVGDDYVVQYSYDSATKAISQRDSWLIPTGVDGKRGGHDLRRRRAGDNNYYVTTNDAIWLFNPEARTFTEVRKSGSPLKGVKTIDQRFDQVVEYGWTSPATFFFLANPSANAQFCMKAYKVRWLYGRDTAGYPEEDATAPTTPGTYTVRLGVFSPGWSSTWHWNNSAATISVGSSFQPSFRVGDGANTWWIEVYTSSDVTAVDVVGGDGRFYLSLAKKSWGAWAGTAPSELGSGDLVRFIARRSSDGATAGSNNFPWLQASPTTDPGWACTFTVGSGASTTWVEVSTSSAATSVEVKVNSGAFTALTYSSASGKWGRAMSVAAGSKVVFRAARSDGARAYSTIYNWLQ
jgi:hypothetical protein